MTEVHRYNLERWKILIQDNINSDMNLDDWCRYKAENLIFSAFYLQSWSDSTGTAIL